MLEIQNRWSRACPNHATCVEVGHDGTNALVRDSKDPNGPVLSFDADEWRAFIEGVKAGVFDWTVGAEAEGGR